MESTSGTYALLFYCEQNPEVQVGKMGRIQLRSGFYIYVGSAFGPGGVKARVLRHCRTKKKHHWHIDYIVKFLIPKGAWYNHGQVHLEHAWARELAEFPGNASLSGFGCTDCSCDSHLFYRPSALEFGISSDDGRYPVQYWRYEA
jgi:Uri superfamily endonuclease